tara:strand:- start:893 stop:1495 length:603 start_codon:yes stop_codon:yes gene_type:complete
MDHVPSDFENARLKSKKSLRAELISRGVWDEFIKVREGFKADGIESSAAWERAAREVLASSGGGHAGAAGGGGLQDGHSPPSGNAPPATGLVSQESFGGKTCNTAKTVEWVASNLAVADAVPEDAPSPESWAMLQWVRSSPSAEAQFWGQIYVKLLPTKAQLDAEARFADDGEGVITLIDQVREASEAAREEEKKEKAAP